MTQVMIITATTMECNVIAPAYLQLLSAYLIFKAPLGIKRVGKMDPS